MKIVIVYNYPVPTAVPCSQWTTSAEHEQMALRFVASYGCFPPDLEHETIVIANGGEPTFRMEMICANLPNVSWVEHDDSGWDIGGFQAVADTLDCDFAVWLGGPAWFRRRGWLKRMAEVWKKYGPGLYGSLASYQRQPHIITTGFWCKPELIRAYPVRVKTYQDRYNFEHQDISITNMAVSLHLPVLLATWDGEYPMPRWRAAENIFRRGDQSNCLTYYRHTDVYDQATYEYRRQLADMSDVIRQRSKPFPLLIRKMACAVA